MRKENSTRRLVYLNKHVVPILLLGSIGAVLHGLVYPIIGLLFASAIKSFYEPPNKLRKDSKFCALAYVGIAIISLIAVPMQNYFLGVAGGKLIERIRSLLFEKVMHQDISWFDDPNNSRYNI